MRMNDTAETHRGTYFRTQYCAVESEVFGLGVKCDYHSIYEHVDHDQLIQLLSQAPPIGLPTHCCLRCDEASRQATRTQREIKVVSG
ncbi:hypothetical protein B0F90DRAFT_1699387 [Multifurca ochricompacta]|uniref:Uncharacterized protein n=1 Tax=Multifurca ochricompacta TaxID=376703 RepID=A0AAD4M9P1_9AGAM|nr:hypothetical protein B0F90DRAFT_1699387 [Multifurca ochricompacta]